MTLSLINEDTRDKKKSEIIRSKVSKCSVVVDIFATGSAYAATCDWFHFILVFDTLSSELRRRKFSLFVRLDPLAEGNTYQLILFFG